MLSEGVTSRLLDVTIHIMYLYICHKMRHLNNNFYLVVTDVIFHIIFDSSVIFRQLNQHYLQKCIQYIFFLSKKVFCALTIQAVNSQSRRIQMTFKL